MVVIEARADRLELRAPFHSDLSLHAKPLGGLWRGQDTGWTFPTHRLRRSAPFV
jgi:hypothetical protein